MPEVVIADREWYRQFKTSTSESDVLGDKFLKKSAAGYQKYLYLLTKYPMRMEYIAFGPNPPIDLMWHTHLIQPKSYFSDCKELMYEVSHHKLLPEEMRTEIVYDARTSEEVKIWEQEFDGESLTEYL